MKKYFPFIGIVVVASSICYLSSCGGYAKPLVKEDVNLTFRRTIDSKDTEVTNFSYDENWFLQDSYTYNPSLAKMSIGLALASFDNSDNYDVNDKSGNKNVKKLYEDLGFSSSSYYSTGYDKEDNENVGLSINYKTFVTDKDEKVNLVAISLRSGGYGKGGWRNNFNLGEGKEDVKEVDNTSYHLGFYNASTFAIEEINNYITKNNISLDNTKFWISGYSRGAAIANIVSIILGDTISRDNLYTYGVATPQYVANVTYDNKFNNIFNIINPGDLVPMIPTTKWGFTRLGTTIDLPSITDTNRKAFEENILNIGGIEYTGENDYSLISQALILELGEVFDTREAYYQQLQGLITSLLTPKEDGTMDYSYINNILTCEGTNKDATTVQGFMVKALTTDFSSLESILQLLTVYSETSKAAIKYWKEKDSYYDELLNNVNVLLNHYISVYLGFESEEEKAALDCLIEMFTKGRKAPLSSQHYLELYLSRMLLD